MLALIKTATLIMDGLMARQITYYFSLLSPWAYIGHAAFMETVGRHGAVVDYRPVKLIQVFSETGGVPLPKRHPARQRYRMLELQRWRDRRGLNFNLRPRFWPFDVSVADKVVVAAVGAGEDPEPFLRAAYAAVWEPDRDLADPQTLGEVAAMAFADADHVLREAGSATVADQYERNTQAAIAADAFGSPVYVLGGEVFWGQDRLDLLDHALLSGRQPFLATV